MKMNKIVFVLLGGSIVFFGFGIIINPRFYDPIYSYYFDFTGYNIPFGTSLILFGSALMWLALRKKAKEFEDKFLVCPKCKTPFNQKDVPDGRCPKCEAKVEGLEAFYERHPELKARLPGRLG